TEVDGWWLDVAPLAPAASAPVAAAQPAFRDVAIADLAAETYAADPVLLPEGGLLDPLAVPALDLALPV
ncbi:MAG: hypothetical protein IMZ65_02230, partial [Planctomycetes bacterium]|nr:hypothetical protein [Planctomycetota bacterium]